LAPHLGLLHLTLHGRNQSREIVLHDVVMRACIHRLDRNVLTEGPRHENKWQIKIPFLYDL
jgi:hypothetical protein